MLREIKWDDVLDDQFDLSGDATGWGLNLSSNLNAGKNDVIRLQFVFGEGIENYMNDAPVDIGIVNNSPNPVTPILGKADSDHRARRLPRPHVERALHAARSATRARTSTTPTARRPTPTRRASTCSATCSTTRCRT